MMIGDAVEFSLMGQGPDGEQVTVVCHARGHVAHIDGDQITVEFSRPDDDWQIRATMGNFEQRDDHSWALLLD